MTMPYDYEEGNWCKFCVRLGNGRFICEVAEFKVIADEPCPGYMYTFCVNGGKSDKGEDNEQ